MTATVTSPPPARPGAVNAPDVFSPVFDWWNLLAVIAVACVYVRAIFFTPIEAHQGEVQKTFYLHPPAAVAAYIAYFVVAVMSVVYLWIRDERADRLAESAMEVATLFTTVAITGGSLWAKPIWGVWWTWSDPRLTWTLFLWFVGVAYMVMRSAIDDGDMRARFSAVLSILAALLIPFIHLTVYLFRTQHPMPIVFKPSEPSLPAEMLITFLSSLAAFAFLCVTLIRSRYRLGTQRDALAALEGDR
jgi:heme exporter protein C